MSNPRHIHNASLDATCVYCQRRDARIAELEAQRDHPSIGDRARIAELERENRHLSQQHAIDTDAIAELEALLRETAARLRFAGMSTAKIDATLGEKL